MSRPSAALVVAVVALAGTWGGPAVAARLVGSGDVRDNSLTGRDIRNRSLRGTDVRSNSLTGRVVAGLSGRDILTDSLDGTDIDEGALAEVPTAARAASAESADRAATAGSVNGARIVRVHYARPATAQGFTTVAEIGGLRLRAACTGSGELAVAAGTSGLGFIRVASTVRSGNAVTPTFNKDDEFNSNEEFNVLAGGADNAIGTLTYTGPDGGVVSVTFAAEGAVTAPRSYACLFSGTAVHAPA